MSLVAGIAFWFVGMMLLAMFGDEIKWRPRLAVYPLVPLVIAMHLIGPPR